MNIDPQIVEQSLQLLRASDKIVVTNHVNPDGDAMGSALGLAGVLRLKGYSVDVIVPNDYPAFLNWMKGNDTVLRFEDNAEEATLKIKEADIIFHLDYNSISRSGAMQDALMESKAKRIMIDHHQQPEDFADVVFSNPKMSSTCEMVYHFIEGMQWLDVMGKDEADCLYTGIITDTGNFRFSATTPITHHVAAHLLEKGVQPNIIASEVYDNNAPNRIKLLSRALEKMEILEDRKTTIIKLSSQDLAELNYTKGDTEGFVNYGLAIRGIIMAVFFVEREGRVKISFRSKGNFDVNELARNHFNGGGHTNAAGGIFNGNLEDTIERFKSVLPQYEAELKKA